MPTILPQPQFLEEGEKRSIVKEEENVCVGGRGDNMSKFLHAYISADADNLPVCCTFNHTFQNPSETIPSLPEEF